MGMAMGKSPPNARKLFISGNLKDSVGGANQPRNEPSLFFSVVFNALK
jgi:hypothetical protein